MKRVSRLSTLAALLFSSVANAQTSINLSPANFNEGVTGVFLDRILVAIPALLGRIINSADYQWFATVVFIFSAVMFITMVIKKYQLDGNASDVLIGFLKVSVIWVLMQNYLTGLMVLKEWQDDFGAMIQFVILGNTNEFYALMTVFNVADKFEFEFAPTWKFWEMILQLISDLTYLIMIGIFITMVALLIIGIAIATLFSTWGFLMVGAVGLFMIPLYLFSPLSWMLDGWVRTLFTVLFYTIFARIVLSVTAFGFDLLMAAGAAENAVIIVSGRDWTALIGCIIWGASSLAALFSIMQYSQSVVSGAGAAMADGRAISKLLSFGK